PVTTVCSNGCGPLAAPICVCAGRRLRHSRNLGGAADPDAGDTVLAHFGDLHADIAVTDAAALLRDGLHSLQEEAGNGLVVPFGDAEGQLRVRLFNRHAAIDDEGVLVDLDEPALRPASLFAGAAD